VATKTCRTTTVSRIPVTMLISHAGKNDPKMLTEGARPHPDVRRSDADAARSSDSRSRWRSRSIARSDATAAPPPSTVAFAVDGAPRKGAVTRIEHAVTAFRHTGPSQGVAAAARPCDLGFPTEASCHPPCKLGRQGESGDPSARAGCRKRLSRLDLAVFRIEALPLICGTRLASRLPADSACTAKCRAHGRRSSLRGSLTPGRQAPAAVRPTIRRSIRENVELVTDPGGRRLEDE